MDSIVARYAFAIVSIAKEENKLSEYKKAFYDLDCLFSSNEKVKKFLESYFVEKEDKYKVIDELCSSYKLKSLSNFLKLITNKHIVIKFHELYLTIVKQINYELNIEQGTIYSVLELTSSQIQKIEESISKKRGHKVELKNKIDESLIGGVRVVINDHIFDGSIKGKLENLRQSLSERRITNEN